MADYSSNALHSNSSFDSMAGLFEPDVILPSQFLAPDEQGLVGGERRLMAAILSDGIEAYIAQVNSASTDAKRSKFDAREWVEIKDYTYVFSFDNVCECLGINPDYLRIGLSRYVAAAQAEALRGGSGKAAWKKIRRPRKK